MIFQYPFIFNITTDGGVQLLGSKVFIDGSNVTEALDADNKTTLKKFVFGDSHDILATKIGHDSANLTSYIVKDPENIIQLNLPKKKVA